MTAEEATLRRCLSEPIPQIAEAAQYLQEAAAAHLSGDAASAAALICQADIPEIYRWLKPIWANSRVWLRGSAPRPPLPNELRTKARMPNASLKALIHERDGYTCRFCGMPVVRPETRRRIRTLYPAALRWGSKEAEQHAAFQAMWAQYDHVVPHAYGGNNDLENLVLTCAACNFGRAAYTLEEVAVADPRRRAPIRTEWDGLESFT